MADNTNFVFFTRFFVVLSDYLEPMDDKWFKQKQKRASVTAEDIAAKLGRDRSLVSRLYVGRQRMTLEQAQVFAEILNVPLTEVLERAGVLDLASQPQMAADLDDADVRSVDLPPVGAMRETAIALGSQKPSRTTWQVNSKSLTLAGYLPKDFILVDAEESERCKAGDIVLASIYEWGNGQARAVLRRFEPPVLVAASTDSDDQRVHVVDGKNVVIKGKVVASWRLQ